MEHDGTHVTVRVLNVKLCSEFTSHCTCILVLDLVPGIVIQGSTNNPGRSGFRSGVSKIQRVRSDRSGVHEDLRPDLRPPRLGTPVSIFPMCTHRRDRSVP